ncbi:MAG: hypothetical protein B6I26_01880 [Desulfobacteraceae bacterium 4572_130]|nr:MAG: hypothetical protein B6I26_01880 [Desulfobacteraceae bacterium 4572_130]
MGAAMETLEAIYDNGKINFLNPPKVSRSKVLVTFLEEDNVDKTISNKEEFPKVNIKEIIKRKSVFDPLDGLLEGIEMSNWKEEKLKYLQEKYE